MSRMYHNEPLSSIPVVTHNVKTSWLPKYSGKGVIVEGVIDSRSRHVISENQNKKRYYVLNTKVTRAHRRLFEANGTEIEPNFSKTTKVRQGYLHSSYKTVPVGQTDLLSPEQARSTLSCPEMEKFLKTVKAPTDTIAFWIEEDQLEKIELVDGDNIRVKTAADSPFIESLAKVDTQSATVSNYAGGEQVGASWTDKVMSVKSDVQQPLPQDLVEGVDEDEWDD